MESDPVVERIKIRIGARADAAKQILIILIGLGITMAITKVFEDYHKDENPRDTFLFLSIFLLYAIRFFFNNWIYLSESYDIELLKQLTNKRTEKGYYYRILYCADFDIAMATIAGLVCGFIGNALFIKTDDLMMIVYISLLVHHITDITIPGINMLLRMREKPSDYDLNVTRVAWWIMNNSWFVIVILLFAIFKVQKSDGLYFLIPWALNSVGAIAIAVRYASGATADTGVTPAEPQLLAIAVLPASDSQG